MKIVAADEIIDINGKKYVATSYNQGIINWARWNYRLELQKNTIRIDKRKYIKLEYLIAIYKRRKFEKKTNILSYIDFKVDEQIKKYSSIQNEGKNYE